MAEHHVSYAPSADQGLIRSTAREFLDDRLPMGRVRELMMSDDGFDRGLWKEMADLGWMGLGIEEAYGGADLGSVELGVLLEEMGRRVTPGPFFTSAVVATAAIGEVGSREQRSELLPPLASGDVIATVALSESAYGWDWSRPGTSATRAGDVWIVEGAKRAVLDAHLADHLVVSAADGTGLGLFLIGNDARGLTVSAESVLDPTRRQSSLTLDGVPAIRLGDGGDATAGLERVLRLGTVALAAEQVGGAQAAMDMAVAYAKTRYQFGRPIGSFQAVKHRCANMLMKIEHARSAVAYATRVTTDEGELAIAAPLAGSVASEAYVWVSGENIQVHGGIGFTWEHDAHIYLKRAKASSLLLGGPRHQRDLLGRALGI